MSSIIARNVGVRFPLFSDKARSMKTSIFSLFDSAAGPAVQYVHALDDVSFEIAPGDRVCLIGVNGSGKTTLLRAIAGILPLATGEIEIDGKVSALLDFATGFEMEMTGWENIISRGLFLGYSAREMSERRAEIAAFADIGDFLHQPVKTYSSGMFIRLAFAIVTSIEPDILLVDEIVGAGDVTFAAKAQQRMISMLEKGNIVVMATHSLDLALSLCNKGVWLNYGEMKAAGPIRDVVDAYVAANAQLT